MAERSWSIVDIPNARNLRQVAWAAGSSGDTFTPFPLDDGDTVLEMSLTASATDFGSATLGLTGANDGAASAPVQDMLGDDIAITAASRKEARLRDRYRTLTPTITGLGGDAIVPVLTIWVRQ